MEKRGTALKLGRFSELSRIKEEQFIELAMKLGRLSEQGRIKEEVYRTSNETRQV